jgi:hypothetical protein
MRQLRPDGWQIATYREDLTLDADELRLVAEGGPVWEKGYRSSVRPTVSQRERQAQLADDNFSCAICGVGAGEPYADLPVMRAQLTVTRIDGDEPRDGAAFTTRCTRCLAFAEPETADHVLSLLRGLSEDDLAALRRWIGRGHRETSALERAWLNYRRLSPSARERVERQLGW